MYAAELLQLDEALEVMEQPDIKMIEKDQETEARRTNSRHHFAKDYALLLREKRASGSVPFDKGIPKAGFKGKEKKPLEATIPHNQVKKLLPPGGSIWQSRTKHKWMAHMPPKLRIHENWDDFCERASAVVLKRLW